METEHAQRQSAVALSSGSGDQAPLVLAKGYGVVAETIIERAHENGLYVHASPDLVNLLLRVDLDAHIPSQLYAAVAQLLAWLHQLEEKAEEIE